ncbi:HR-like lesion-inducing protein-related isoform X1 [Zea mays]|uniref:HR-like lesion-inducing protein-related n=2 Tax=Zea mays TaxID=4577 RepID=A0A1D6J435_MAIZE|nr:uncharacterized protein LOC100279232 isoform X1 [Zea mays]AQK42742.1 HR-like lesion-inducing protein-related [Zea mays]|eukprot:XP_008661795.1 uncharacterized protein LOC100279232 isoform X1 [Zea mays]
MEDRLDQTKQQPIPPVCGLPLPCLLVSSVSPPCLPETQSRALFGRRRSATTTMGFISFVGRVLFASLFLLSAYQEFIEFGNDGGPAAKTLKPKFNLFVKLVSKNTGLGVPHIDIKTVIAATMFLKGFGGLLFIVSSSFGAFLLLIYLAFITPIVYDFYNHEMESTLFVDLFFKFIQNLAFMGALLFFLGMKNSIPKRRSKGRTTKTKTN